MFRATSIACVAYLLLLSDQTFALSKRQNAATSTVAGATASTLPTAASSTIPDAAKTTLQPVLPPDNDPEDFSILNPDPQLNLYYGGLQSNVTKRDGTDTDGGILVNLDFTFLHPSVPLDYSSFISGVVCSGNNTMTGIFSTASAYAFGKKAWTGLDNLLLITSADGCGADNQNDVFLATSVTFDDDDLSFTASGAEYLVKDVAHTSDITWGNVTPTKLRKRTYTRDASQYSDVVKRLCLTSCHYGAGFSVSLGFMLADQEGMEVDDDAPWPNAVLLAEFGPDDEEGGDGEGGEEGSGSEEGSGGESKLRRSASTTDLVERDGLEYGLKLYCVDCGFQGTATAQGSLGINWLTASVYNAKVTLDGNMYAGMFLGLEMFAEYSKTWEHDFVRQYLNPWEIPLILEFGPYIRMGVEATIDIKAQGTLLLGASATWGGFEAVMDFLNPDSSSATGFDPTIERKAEAAVELSAEATLGLPVGIGLGVTVFDTWSVDVELTDTPALVADATFTASIDADGCSGPGCDSGNSTDTDDCDGGIAWSVGFRNTLAVTVTDFDTYEINVWNSDPIADGCINILGGGDDGNSTSGDGGDNGDGSGDGDGGDNGDSGNGTCTAGAVVATTSRPRGTYCSFQAGLPQDSSQFLRKISHLTDATECAAKCLKNRSCKSFGWNTARNQCRLYSDPVVNLDIARAQRGNKLYYDVGCYEVQTCESAA